MEAQLTVSQLALQKQSGALGHSKPKDLVRYVFAHVSGETALHG